MGSTFLLKEVNHVLTKKGEKKETICHLHFRLEWGRLHKSGMWNAKSQGKVCVKLSRNVSWPLRDVAKLQAEWRARLLFFLVLQVWRGKWEEAEFLRRHSTMLKNKHWNRIPPEHFMNSMHNLPNEMWPDFFFFPKSLPVMACWSKGKWGFWSPAGLTTCKSI